MELDFVDFEDTNSFAPIFLDYLSGKQALTPFYSLSPSLKNYGQVINTRKLEDDKRRTLVHVLASQYGPISTSEQVEFNIHSLADPRTFTLTTGHQLNIFTGPLYFMYKIMTVINACRNLKDQYPDYHFVPVYWMASEDHDLEEINHFNLFGKEHRWETDQTGAVGRMKPHSLNTLIDQLTESVPLFEQAYLDHDTLADAVRFYVNELFGEQGLLVLDADNKELKAEFRDVIREELFENSSNQIVSQTSEKLASAGYDGQAHSREINLFFMENGIRERLVRKPDGFKVLNTDSNFTEDEISRLIDEHPEKFSPNVILRPLFQEMVLPNLSYTGGPAEVAYWLQLKELFDHYHTEFPILLPRAFALVVNRANEKKFQKLGLNSAQLFQSAHELKSAFLESHNLEGFQLNEERKGLATLFEAVKKKAVSIDGSLEGFIGAESSKSFKSLDAIEKRLKKALEDKNDTSMNQIDTLKEKLFPNGTLQERSDNYLTFQLNHPSFLDEVRKKLDPFAFRFHVFHDV